MQIEEFYIDRPKSARLFVRQWLPDSDVCAIVIMVHGLGEHSGCYEQWAGRFVDQSVGFIAFDLRGHGRSSGKRGCATLDNMNDDLKFILKRIHKKYPGVPVFLYGHSMGGHIVLNYAIQKGVKVQGIIASSPWLRLVHPPPSWLIGLAASVGVHIFPSLTVKTGIKAEHLTHNGTGTRSTKTDPLMHKKISIKLFTDLWINSNVIMRNKHRLNVPLLLMHGKADQLTSYRASKSFAHNAGKYTEYKQWKGMGHDLLNDTNQEAVFQYALKWILRQVKNHGAVQNSSKMYRVA